ncbi:hypothetical protein BDN70DRAFT_886199, partial [Pholiota conissans]
MSKILDEESSSSQKTWQLRQTKIRSSEMFRYVAANLHREQLVPSEAFMFLLENGTVASCASML